MSTKVLILIGVLALTLIGLIAITSFKKISPSPSNIPAFSPSPTQSSIPNVRVDFSVTNITPTRGTILKPDQPLEFSITFNKQVDLSWLGINLLSGAIGSTSLSNLQYTSKFSSNNQILTISAGTASPSNQYQLDLTNNTTGIKVLSINYPSDQLITPAPSNNLALSAYLPYETSEYKLSFNQSSNSYIFNFKYDTNSSLGIDDQFNKAKADATSFIQSKGIDINSITIEWRHS